MKFRQLDEIPLSKLKFKDHESHRIVKNSKRIRQVALQIQETASEDQSDMSASHCQVRIQLIKITAIEGISRRQRQKKRTMRFTKQSHRIQNDLEKKDLVWWVSSTSEWPKTYYLEHQWIMSLENSYYLTQYQPKAIQDLRSHTDINLIAQIKSRSFTYSHHHSQFHRIMAYWYLIRTLLLLDLIWLFLTLDGSSVVPLICFPIVFTPYLKPIFLALSVIHSWIFDNLRMTTFDIKNDFKTNSLVWKWNSEVSTEWGKKIIKKLFVS